MFRIWLTVNVLHLAFVWLAVERQLTTDCK